MSIASLRVENVRACCDHTGSWHDGYVNGNYFKIPDPVWFAIMNISRPQIESLTKSLSDEQTKNANLQREMTTLQNRCNTLQSNVKALDASIVGIRTQFQDSTKALLEKNSRVSTLEAELEQKIRMEMVLKQQLALLHAETPNLNRQLEQAIVDRARALGKVEEMSQTLLQNQEVKAKLEAKVAKQAEIIEEFEDKVEAKEQEYLLKLQQEKAALQEKRREYKEEKKLFLTLLSQSQTNLTELTNVLASQGLSFNSAESSEAI